MRFAAESRPDDRNSHYRSSRRTRKLQRAGRPPDLRRCPGQTSQSSMSGSSSVQPAPVPEVTHADGGFVRRLRAGNQPF